MGTRHWPEDAEDALEKMEAERDRLREAVRQIKLIMALLDERVALLERSDNDRADDYFRGRNVGELAGTELAADALRAALKEVE